MNRYSCFICGIILLFITSFTGCTKQNLNATSFNPEPSVNLIYYTIGDPDKDLALVNDKINEILMKKIGITMTYNKMGWQEYDDRMNTLISSDSPFDIAFAPYYAKYAKRGVWLKLDDYFMNLAKEMYLAIDPIFWKGAEMDDGFIYGVPTNKELAVREHWMYPESLVKKYNIEVSQYNTLESLEPLLRMIQKNEPDYLPMQLDRYSQNFFAMYGYEYIADNKIPLMIQSLDATAPVVNIFETREAKHILDTLRRYYQSGFINQDAALREPGGLRRGVKVFWESASGGPLSESVWSNDLGYEIVTNPVTPEVATTEAVRGGMMVVNAHTKHPVESIKFLNLLNTDPELRNLFNYGIEGIHYTLDPKGQVVLSSTNDSQGNPLPKANAGYTGIQYTQGNWFILNTLGGSYPDPLNKWDQFRINNSKVVESQVLGFTPDLSEVNEQINNIEIVWRKYYPSLMTGSVDVDTILPKFNHELYEAGIDKVRKEIQKQLDRWREGK
jgi:ABC-type glycerol-3-phosphate transport system substrate-binding protein